MWVVVGICSGMVIAIVVGIFCCGWVFVAVWYLPLLWGICCCAWVFVALRYLSLSSVSVVVGGYLLQYGISYCCGYLLLWVSSIFRLECSLYLCRFLS